jgi:hypothetical protein
VAEHDSGIGWSAIGRALDSDGIPTAQGGVKWYAATVRAVYRAATERAA